MTNDVAYTRCPGCRTVFRVTREQLALREGQVRCGQCRAVFDATNHWVKVESGEPPAVAGGVDAANRAHVDAEDVDAKSAVDVAAEDAGLDEKIPPDVGTEDQADVDAANAEVVRAEAAAAAEADDEARASDATAEGSDAARDRTEAVMQDERRAETAPIPPFAQPPEFEWRPRTRLREQPRALYALAIVALIALAGAQGVLEYRDTLAAHAPITRPLLEAACRLAGCAIEPLRDASALSIEASDLQADPAHKGLLKLTATVRNRAAYPIAYPYLELTLTDASDGVVARRAFPPSAYIGAGNGGIAGDGELSLTMFLDASATSQAGYRLYLFYP